MTQAVREFILRLVVNAVGLYVIAVVLGSKEVKLEGLEAAAFVVFIWCVLTACLRPLLFAIKLVTSPLNWITLGLYGLILGFLLNVIVLVSLGLSHAFEGFEVGSFWSALKVAALFSIVNSATTILIGGKKDRR